MNDKTQIPAMPPGPPENVAQWRRFFRFPGDMFSALPRKLYRAWMAEVRTPFYHSFFINEPELQKSILGADPRIYPKSPVAYAELTGLLGNGIFVSNGELWERQRRIINPAFEGGRVRTAYEAMQGAADAFIERWRGRADGHPFDIEFDCSFFAADIIFRTLFSVPIEQARVRAIFDAFQDYQRAQPVWNIPSLLRAPKWVPRFQPRIVKRSAKIIRKAIGELVDLRLEAIARGDAPDDLATKILTTADPKTGKRFDREEMIDQVAIFFLAGHETSAAALAWALYLLAFDKRVQSDLAEELAGFEGPIEFGKITRLPLLRNVFHETLRLYAPVPMLVRESTSEQEFRERKVSPRDLCILSPWFSGRHERIWDEPHAFRPSRWDKLPQHCRDAYIPFSAGGRICIGAGFALIEGLLGIASVIRNFEVELGDVEPVPVAHLTVRSKSGIYLRLSPRD